MFTKGIRHRYSIHQLLCIDWIGDSLSGIKVSLSYTWWLNNQVPCVPCVCVTRPGDETHSRQLTMKHSSQSAHVQGTWLNFFLKNALSERATVVSLYMPTSSKFHLQRKEVRGIVYRLYTYCTLNQQFPPPPGIWPNINFHKHQHFGPYAEEKWAAKRHGCQDMPPHADKQADRVDQKSATAPGAGLPFRHWKGYKCWIGKGAGKRHTFQIEEECRN